MSDKALVKHLQKEVARLESELRSPGSGCDYGALLRKKDLQIEKVDKIICLHRCINLDTHILLP